MQIAADLQARCLQDASNRRGGLHRAAIDASLWPLLQLQRPVCERAAEANAPCNIARHRQHLGNLLDRGSIDALAREREASVRWHALTLEVAEPDMQLFSDDPLSAQPGLAVVTASIHMLCLSSCCAGQN